MFAIQKSATSALRKTEALCLYQRHVSDGVVRVVVSGMNAVSRQAGRDASPSWRGPRVADTRQAPR